MLSFCEEQNLKLGPCERVNNGVVEFAFPLTRGIRISGLNLLGKPNLFFEQPAEMNDDCCRPNGWRLEGGLRLWLAPESEASYYPDNAPIAYERLENGVMLTQPRDGYLNIEKRVIANFDPEDAHALRLTYCVRNLNAAPIAGSLWAVTTFAPLGQGGFRFFSKEEAMLPARSVSLWNNTGLDDPRVHFKENAVEMRHMPLDRYFKMGFTCVDGACWFERDGQRLTKRFEYDARARYPDGGVNLEVFMCRHMMELETLGPLEILLPGLWVCRSETWTLAAA